MTPSQIEALGYTDPKPLTEGGMAGEWAGIMKLMFTHAIIAGIGPDFYEERWCYHTYAEARAALDAWDGGGEPQG